MNIISFSLYGTNILYLEGMIMNINLATKHFPDWICRIYYKDIPVEYINKYNIYKNVELIEIINLFDNDILNYSYYKMARYLPLSDTKINKFIVMDADGRICQILVDIVKRWNASNKSLYFCIHADDNVICGGLWGCNGGLINNIENIFKNYVLLQSKKYNSMIRDSMWGLDQRWVNDSDFIHNLLNKNDYIAFVDKTAPPLYMQRSLYMDENRKTTTIEQ